MMLQKMMTNVRIMAGKMPHNFAKSEIYFIVVVFLHLKLLGAQWLSSRVLDLRLRV